VAVEAVGAGRLVGRGWPRGEDAPVGEDLERVGVDDLTAEAVGDLERQRGLSARGRSGEEHRRLAPGRLEDVRRSHLPPPVAD
jgi:hypothetical protein